MASESSAVGLVQRLWLPVGIYRGDVSSPCTDHVHCWSAGDVLEARESVEDVWLNVLADMPNDPRCLQIADYVTTQWIEGDLPIAAWNHSQTTGPRTFNHLEGWHGRLEKIVAKAHPNVFEMLAFFRNEQKLNEIKLVQYGAGQPLPPKRKNYCHINTRINTLKQSLQNGTMGVFAYADTASHLMKVQ